MKCLYTVRSRSVSIALPLAMACIVIATPAKPVYGMNVNQLQAKARQGYVAEQIELGEAYLTGKGILRSAADAAYWLEKAAQSGNPEAQNMVGYMYQTGYGVQANAARAMHWYELAAASGSSDAMLNLGVLHMVGLGVAKNPARAAEYFERAVERGNGSGAAYLGTMALEGIGVKQDPAASERWFNKDVKLHDPLSTYDLRHLYSTAADHPHNLEKAAGYLHQAAKMNYVPAMQLLAVVLAQHPQLPGGITEATRLFNAAADGGSWQASVVLAVFARTGTGMPVDNKAAYFHLQVALLQGGAAASDQVRRHSMGFLPKIRRVR